eukprot:790946_1
MGSLCSCCSRRKVTLSKNTSNDANATLLNSSDSVESDTISRLKATAQQANLAAAGYGATSYTRLKDDKTGTTHELNKDHPTFHSITPEAIIEETHGGEIKHSKENEDGKEKEKEAKRIDIQSTNLLIVDAGYDEINGGYRWFPHQGNWCLFTENESYVLSNGVQVDAVYEQLKRLQSVEANFRWKDDIKHCWTISNMDRSAIYYAAPMTKDYVEYIPNQKGFWISVHGSLPAPDIYANLIDGSLPPDKLEQFGNVSPKLSWVKQRSHGSSVSSLQPITETSDKMNNMDSDLDDKKDKEIEDKTDYKALMDKKDKEIEDKTDYKAL